MGRPKLAPHERRDDHLPNIRVTTAEREELEARAARAGLTLTELTRRAVFSLNVPERSSDTHLNSAALVELNRVGTNLNQIARALNAGRDLPHSLEAALMDIRAAVAELARGS